MKYLIAGPSGTGKTTVAAELSKLGYLTIETDHEPELGSWTNLKSGERVPHNPPFSEEWLSQHKWLWQADVLKKLLDRQSAKQVFLIGGAANATDFFDLFDKVFALSIDGSTMKHRLQNRKPERLVDPERWLDINPEIGQILKWNDEFKEIYKSKGVVFIDGSLPPGKIAEKIVEHINE